MSYLTPHHHYNPFTWGNTFSNDMRAMRRMLDMTDSASKSAHTVEPSYRYEADEKAGHFEIEMPGVSKENLSIEVHDNKLFVRGKRFKKSLIDMGADETKEAEMMEGEPQENGEQEKDEPVPSVVYLLEARLPQGADVDGIKADHVGDGILTMTVPMMADKGSRRIQIEF